MQAKLFPRWLLAAVALAIAAVLAGGSWLYTTQRRSLRQSAEATLLAAANLKVDQIAGWRNELRTDAATAMNSPFFAAGVARWIASSQAADTYQVLTRLRAMREPHRYHDILLVDSQGQFRSSASGNPGYLSEATAAAIATALGERLTVLTDIQAGTDDSPAHIDAVAPLFGRGEGDTAVIGAIVLQADVGEFLYPLIQTWPTPSETAETLIVRRDGDAVLFLNELRHRQDTAFSLRIPLNQTDLPAAMAVSGREGVVEGNDYRNVRVLAALKRVPDSSWFMVSKVDMAEVLKGWRLRSGLILGLTLALVLMVASAAGVVWQNHEKTHYLALAQARASLHESEERWRMTLMSVGDGVIATDAEGRVVMLNPVAETLAGWSQAEAAGRPLDEVFRIINEETRETVESPAGRVLREGVIVGLANHTILIARDGTEHPVADSGAPIRLPNGTLTGVVLVFRDQTAERKTARALQDSRQELKAIYDHAPVMMCLVGQDRRIIYANQALMDFVGVSRSDLKEAQARDVFGCISGLEDPGKCGIGSDCENCALRLAMEDTLRTGNIHRNIEHHLAPDENARRGEVFLLGSTALIHAGGKPHLLLCLNDITDRRRTQEDRDRLAAQLQHAQKLESLGVMAGGIAHDFNNLLTVIQGNADMLAETANIDPTHHAAVQNIRTATEHAAYMTRALQAFSRPAATEHRPVDANALVQEAYKLLRRVLPAIIEFRIEPAPRPCVISCDPGQIQQVLVNLCVNARDAMPAGGTLRIETRIVSPRECPGLCSSTPPEGRCVLIRVADTGHGMDETTQAKIFDPFFTTKPKDVGTGLGLAIVYRIVQSHQGHIEVTSTPDKGTRFDLCFPLIATREPASPPPLAPAVPGEGRILIVDDQPMVASFLRTLLESRGYQTVVCHDGEQATDALRSTMQLFDAAIVDYDLPGMTGVTCLRRLRSHQPDLKAVLISGHGVAQEQVDLPDVQILWKPFSASHITRAVRDVLKGTSDEDEGA